MADAQTTSPGLPASVGFDPTMRQVLDSFKVADTQAQGYYAKAQGTLDKTADEVKKRDAEADEVTKTYPKNPAVPTLRDIPDAPQPEMKDPTEALGGVMTQLALLGSLFTRAPLTTGLNAAASAMDGFHKGDKERAKLEFERWDASVSAAKTQNQKELDQYNAVLQNNQLTTDQKNARLRAIAAANSDTVVLGQLQAGGYEKAADIIMKRAEGQAKLMELWQRQEELRAYKTQPTLDNDTLRYAAYNYKKTNQMPPLGMASTADRKAIVTMAAHMDDDGNVIGSDAPAAAVSPGAPGATDAGPSQPPKPSSVIDRARADIVGRASNKADAQTLAALEKQSSFIEKFEGQMLKNMDVAEGLLDKGSGSDVGPVINRWIQGGRRATSDKDVADLNTAIFAVAMEYAKISSGSTGAAGSTDSSKAEAQEIVNRLDSADTIRSVFGIMRTEAHNAVDSNNEQIKKTKDGLRGTPAPDNAGTRAPAAGSIPLPPEHADDPDGTTYNGGAYIKRGKAIVPNG